MRKTACLLLLLCTFILLIYSCEKGSNGVFIGNFSEAGVPGTPDTPEFNKILENKFIKTLDSPTSTFSIDADGASYAAMRRWAGTSSFSVIKEALRTEEFINYFPFNYAEPTGNAPIAVNGEVSSCPWNSEHKLIRIGIKGKSVPRQDYPSANFVLLIDVSGSMDGGDKLDLLKNGFIDFVNGMRPQDRVAIVTYAGKAGLVLNSTSGNDKSKIIGKIKGLKSGGSTNGAGGINLAYEIAEQNFIRGGNNRVILGTDGDFNVGISSQEDLVKLIEQKRDKGVFFTVLGVGFSNLNDGVMEQLANKGNGNYEYLDNTSELKKVFVDEYSKFLTVAKDVKVQVIFNPMVVEEYRLIGYENRVLAKEDFKNDKKDAGEIGAGQTITALYEIKPKTNVNTKIDPTFTIDFRYKKPDEAVSAPLSLDIFDEGKTFDQSSENMRFASSLAGLGLYLRGSAYKGTITLSDIKAWAGNAKTFDPFGYRSKHMELLNKLP